MTDLGAATELSLPDVLQLMTVAGRTGRLQVRAAGGHGLVFLIGGEIVHAQTPLGDGEAALYELVTWPADGFDFLPDATSTHRSIARPADVLLREAARQLAEWGGLEPLCAVGSAAVRLADRSGALSFTAEEWEVVRRIGAGATIAGLERRVHRGRLELGRVLSTLARRGIVELELGPSAPRSGAAGELVG